MSVRPCPPRDSVSSRVSFESRYGMCPPRLRGFASEEMTLPSVKRDLLMCAVSLRASPVVLLSMTRSDPARSTKHSRPDEVFPSPCSAVRCSVIMQCERVESLLSRCDPTWIGLGLGVVSVEPLLSRCATSSGKRGVWVRGWV